MLYPSYRMKKFRLDTDVRNCIPRQITKKHFLHSALSKLPVGTDKAPDDDFQFNRKLELNTRLQKLKRERAKIMEQGRVEA